ncbi:MAG: CidA/LrgA family protein [Salinivirgaceae bacterium]|nr:CidA/LrgA family protein [Salinivirgaceae bacterium]MBO7434061.1 CidA/LrgA family protein [Salinivirgaceae bacterium]MBO7594493.1 CidA/LrgA family protein [Salinivirgaceae bacterium]
MKGILILLSYLIVGEGISMLINHFVPGNVIGMVLLFASLQAKIVKPESVEKVSEFLTKNMTIMFLPPSIGLIASYKILGNNIVTIVLAIVVSTMLVLAVVGKLMDKLDKTDESNN